MLFCSLFFISVFLPFLLFCYYCFPLRWRNTLLLLASLIFYAWGEIVMVWLMIGSITINHLLALQIDSSSRESVRKLFLAVGIVINLAALCYFKYLDFFIGNLNFLFQSHIPLRHIVLPIGISFYTFQAISYLVDVYRGEKAEKNILNTGLYISFFPQLIAGPIIKFHEISAQLEKRNENLDNFTRGAQRFIEGLAKKVLIANVMAETADMIFACENTVLTSCDAWLGAFAYTMQIFFDFSGYSDMAIGLGLMFGFKIPENFNYPYSAWTLKDFWRRWHISLSTWFREYLYIPLGGNRKSEKNTLCNLIIVFAVTGFWHGASWTFVFWGLWHGFFIILEKILNVEKKTFSVVEKIFMHIYLLLVVVVGWVFFRAENFTNAWMFLKKMFAVSGWGSPSLPISGLFVAAAVFAVFFSTALPRKIYNKFSSNWIALLIWRAVCCGLLFLVLLRLAGASYNPFIYFRF